jgi:predicted O-linked N-acetylglucosamine transferase (SPINDLY family)
MAEIQVQQVLEEAVRLHQAGQLEQAIARYREIILLSPNHVEAMQRLGIALHQYNRTDEAVQWLEKAVELSPNSADCYANLGAVQGSQGNLAAAIKSFTAAIRLRSDVPQLHFNLANALRYSGRLEEAADEYRKALSLSPDRAEAWNSLGGVLTELKQFERAVRAYRRAIELRPTTAEAHNNLAVALQKTGDLKSATASYRQAVSLAPSNADARNNLSAALQELGMLDEALSQVQVAVSIKPNDAPTLFNLGNALGNLGRSQEAVAAYQKAISLRPNYPEAHYSLGSALRDLQRLDDAVVALNKSIELRPDFGEAYGNLAAVLREKGELDESIAAYRKAAELTDLPWIAGNLLYTLHFHPDYDARRLYEEHVKWNQRYAKPIEGAALNKSIAIPPGNPHYDRKLRIGYVSGEFRNHQIGRFMLPLLSHHDRQQFEIFCYSDTLRLDSFSEKLRSHVDVWRNTVGMNDSQFSERVRQDGIDILVDLTLHARTGRMMAFATKPAPIQVTYLAYCSTSGLRTMDYRLSDPYLDPPDFDVGVYFEKTIRLKSYWCYPGALSDVPVTPPPALSQGHITFGCLNIFAKVTRPTLLTWFEILRRVPSSRLMIHAMPGDHRQRVHALAASEGIDPARIQFVGFLPGQRFYEQYNHIDIALDPFPYAGGTTTCDALWMGVPVVSLTGTTAVSRAGASILSTVGLPHHATSDRTAYIDLAADLAAELEQLQSLRSALRRQMAASPLMDAAAFARDVESAYLLMWNETRATGLAG